MPAPTFKSYLFQTIIITMVLCLFSGVLFYFYPQYYFFLFPYLMVFFIVSTPTIHYFLTISAAKLTPQRFVSHFMMVMGCKMFIYLIILISIAYNIPKNEIVSFAITFFMLYLIYSVFEIRSVLAYFRNTSDITK